ncbi:MAG: transposase [Parcubacteria group bacterium]|nr:transposase [Parcubacteria group bacterium]
MRKLIFIDDEIYHIYNRGVEKRNIFATSADYLRFIHDLVEFNNTMPAMPSNQRFGIKLPKQLPTTHLEHILETKSPKYKPLAQILAFVLMPNHFHLMLKQSVENGIARFMHKLGVGYTMYFNQKYDRTGALFQGTYKAKLVNKESHFIHLPFYIHANPLDIKYPGWREGKVSNPAQALKFLENYRWSSFLDYTGTTNLPSVTQRKLLLDYFDGTKNYRREFIQWLQEPSLAGLQNVLIE